MTEIGPLDLARVVGSVQADFVRSPYTGWTREHHVALADASLLALRPYATPGHARFTLPGPASNAGPASDGLEAFARSFLAVGFRLAGSTEDPHDHAGFYAAGLAAGTDPSSPDRWPRMNEVRQARVEAAAIAIALHESRSWIWDRLSAPVQERVVDWLSEAVDVDLATAYGFSNWRWFCNVTQAFLRSVGGPYDRGELDENLAFLDQCYVGDGWYADGRPDGRSGNVDWYNAWVMHLFSLWYGRMSVEHESPELLQRYRDRLAAFLPVGDRLFGTDGAPLFQGRSLVYRHATAGLFWAGPVFGVDTLGPGAVRRLGSQTLGYFVDHGAYDERGLLSLGWHGAFAPMRQGYSGPGSPYWANLGFAGLVLPAEHEVWTAVEERPAASSVQAARPIGWLLGDRGDGAVRVVNHGVDHSPAAAGAEDPQYCRYAYSTVTAPVPLPADRHDPAAVADNQVALVDAAGRWSQRRPITTTMISSGAAGSRHEAGFVAADGSIEPGPEIASWSVLHGPVEVRLARVRDVFDGPLVISGYAVPSGDHWQTTVVPLLGELDAGRTTHDVANPFGNRLEVPWVRTRGPVLAGALYAAAVVLSELDVALPDLQSCGDTVEIAWPDGHRDLLDLT